MVIFPAITRAQLGSVQLKVDPRTDKDYEQARGGGARTTTEKVRLKISLRNFKAVERNGLKVKSYIFADNYDMDEMEIALEDSDTVDLPKAGTAEVESREAGLQYTGAYMKKVGTRRERVDKSGRKYAGYGVQVWEGDQLVAEIFEPREFKKLLEKNDEPKAPAAE